jgi:valyl-tRNA synthetase
VQLTLYNVLYRVIQLLAPISPHITEEIYEAIYKEEVDEKSLQLTPWPEPDTKRIDEDAERKGDAVMAVITEIRREKAEKRKPLNAQIKRLKLYAGKSELARTLSENKEDIAGTCKITHMEILAEKGKGRQVPENPAISFVSEY